MDLNKLRADINKCDDEILAAFTRRMALCRDVAAYKLENGLPVFQREREDAVLARLGDAAEPSLRGGTVALFSEIMDISKCLQQLRIGAPVADWTEISALPAGSIVCQGVRGANSDTAAQQLFPGAQPTFLPDFPAVFAAVANGTADYGIVPVRNSTVGTIAAVYALLTESAATVAAATTVEIRHCLAARPAVSQRDLTAVRSHPEALRQCSRFLRESGLPVAESANTAVAAQEVGASREALGAICSPDCAARYGLQVLAADIADCVPNYTRFFCLSAKKQYTQNADVISVLVTLPHTEGSLCRLLTKFYACGLDLLHLESRPIADGSFHVRFYLDFRGNLRDAPAQAMLAELRDSLPEFRLLGCYAYRG